MTTSIADKSRHQDDIDILTAIKTDLAALRASVVAITAKLDVLTAKLNADTGVADTNYATNFAASCDPAALTLEA